MSGQTLSRPPRVLIADDQNLFRSGLARLLREDPRVEVVGEANDGVEAVELATISGPDVVLMDLTMPRLDGAQATREIGLASPNVKVLILTTFDSDTHVIQAMRAGARGYVLKDSTPDSIVTSILSVMSGERVLAAPIAKRMIARLTGDRSAGAGLDGLTTRDIEILKLISRGSANKQIAFALQISEKTVRNHVSKLYDKLGIADRAEAVLYAVRSGLVEA